ncbi:MAG: hypothetical protein A2017_13730 [Lentisphaerae bacterium GWF2_44_16]|nr:MAG: hypothetical protein A2017_13730 [Lentisphaerae bacterium GWF2_44_16]
MKIIDLSLPVTEKKGREGFSAALVEKIIFSNGVQYTGIMYDLVLGSMAGTYIDFPGHIKETDDGFDALNYPIEKLYRIESAVIHLDRKSNSGAVNSDDLKNACGKNKISEKALIINALGKKRFNEVDERSVYLSSDAVRWIVESGIHLLVSDIYESKEIHGVFYDLFKAGISTVCCPVNLHLLDSPRCMLSVFAPPLKGITQLPCRAVAEC